jgi:hypothetical protein
MKRFWYLATPYSKFPRGLTAAFDMAAQASGMFLKAGIATFSPIVQTHPIAFACGIDALDHSIWLPFDEPMMDAAFGLIVFEAMGWRDSFGIKQEIAHFERARKPVLFFNPAQDIARFQTEIADVEAVWTR